MYLFYFVRLKPKETANRRHGGIDFDKKLMITITYTYICLLFFTFPYFAERIVNFVFPQIDPVQKYAILGQNLSIFKFICKCMHNSLQ